MIVWSTFTIPTAVLEYLTETMCGGKIYLDHSLGHAVYHDAAQTVVVGVDCFGPHILKAHGSELLH